jgi:hypothetical protein
LGALGVAGSHAPQTALPGPRPVFTLSACYAHVLVPAVFDTQTGRELVQEASQRIEHIPAKYAWVDQVVMVQEPAERLEGAPASYRIAEEKILVKPATTQVTVIPAEYTSVTEQEVDTPAHTAWQKGSRSLQRFGHRLGSILCRVEVPATHRTVTKRVLQSPATIQTTEIPAQYVSIKKRLANAPATTHSASIPGVYKIIKVQKLISLPQTTRVAVPAQYRTVTRKIKIQDSRLEWQPVLCRSNVTPALVKTLQQFLQRAGHSPGPIDGVFGRRTLAAVEAYQRAQGLAVGGLTFETLAALGIDVLHGRDEPGLPQQTQKL